MSPHQTISVAVRLFAVALAIFLLRQLLAFYFGDGGYQDSYGLVVTLAIAVVSAAVVLGLWFFPQSIARALLSSSEAQPSMPTSPDTWLSMGCALIGLWILSTSLPELIRESLLMYLYRSSYDVRVMDSLRIFRYLLEVAIAIWLIFGAKGFRRVFWWAQNAGRNRAL